LSRPLRARAEPGIALGAPPLARAAAKSLPLHGRRAVRAGPSRRTAGLPDSSRCRPAGSLTGFPVRAEGPRRRASASRLSSTCASTISNADASSHLNPSGVPAPPAMVPSCRRGVTIPPAGSCRRRAFRLDSSWPQPRTPALPSPTRRPARIDPPTRHRESHRVSRADGVLPRVSRMQREGLALSHGVGDRSDHLRRRRHRRGQPDPCTRGLRDLPARGHHRAGWRDHPEGSRGRRVQRRRDRRHVRW